MQMAKQPGCRCEAVQLPGSKYDETPNSKITMPDVPDMFRVNFGKKGVAFPAGHAYFRRLPDGFAKEAKNMAHEEVRRVIVVENGIIVYDAPL